jgi:PAS domain S-box-containing protein
MAMGGLFSVEPSGEVLRGLVSAAPDALLAVDADGRIVYVNDQAELLFGWSRGDLEGKPVEELVPVRFAGGHPRLRAGYLAHAVRRPMGAGLDLWARRRDGSEFPAEISLSSIPSPQGRLIAAAVRDVTDRRQLEHERREQALEAQREQSHRLEALGQLAGGIAHDFNNLLGVILNYSTLLARTAPTPQAAQDLAEIQAAAERGAGLTKQLLTFARRDVAHPEPLEVNDVVTGVASMLDRTLGEQVEVELDLSSTPLVAMADRHQLEQIVMNLAINARDAMPDGGTIRIGLRRAPAGARRDDTATSGAPTGDGLLLTVTDTGSGMDETVLSRAVEPFFTTKPLGKGTGLGLATVYGIVSQHGGSLDLDSRLGQGTTVTVRLPLADTVPAATSEIASAPAPGRAERILLAEDEAALRIGTARLLEANGYDVVTAPDGNAAWEAYLATDLPFDLVLSDMVMPHMKGDELASRVASSTSPVPVVLMSGYDSTGVTPLPDEVLVKPVGERELLRAVREALDGR